MKKLALYIGFILFWVLGYSQDKFIHNSRMLVRIPFHQLTGGVILLKAQLDTFPDTLNFILDTGSGGISLDSSTVDYLNLEPTPSQRTIRGIAGVRTVGFLHDKTLHFPGLKVDSLDFHINNYEVLTAVYGLQIDGIIGYSVLNRYITKINYDSLHIEFWTKGYMKYPKGGYLLKPYITTLPVHYAEVRDENTLSSRFLFDLGAGLNVLFSSDFARDSSLFRKKRRFFIKEAEGIGGSIEMKMTVIRQVKLGPYKFKKVPVYVFDDEYNITSYPYLGGLIGSDLLRRFNIILNYQEKEFHLRPNSHYRNPFDYVYTGIELYYVNGSILVGDVARNSPAEESGLKEGDIVVAVNRDFSQNLQHYKDSLQKSVGKAKVIVLRNGELKEFIFKVQSIL